MNNYKLQMSDDRDYETMPYLQCSQCNGAEVSWYSLLSSRVNRLRLEASLGKGEQRCTCHEGQVAYRDLQVRLGLAAEPEVKSVFSV